ncbi:MAG: hypothetical protein IPM24_24870 [Bryobacterales bacterium]|jgi:hypothetical protein|nr:hypothetical protein [Bryobacterales bacterium]
MELLRDFWRYVRHRKKYWMIPLFVLLALFGSLLVLAQGSALAPFLYTLF